MQLGLNQLYHVSKNPLPWLDEMLNAVEHANFFENRATEYSQGLHNRHVGGGIWRPDACRGDGCGRPERRPKLATISCSQDKACLSPEIAP